MPYYCPGFRGRLLAKPPELDKLAASKFQLIDPANSSFAVTRTPVSLAPVSLIPSTSDLSGAPPAKRARLGDPDDSESEYEDQDNNDRQAIVNQFLAPDDEETMITEPRLNGRGLILVGTRL